MNKFNSFNDLSISPSLKTALQSLEYSQPSPIQLQAIPIIMESHDLIACAQTGTGKTLAFCLPTVEALLTKANQTALILAPTREIAQQIEVLCRALLRGAPQVRAAILIGGMSMQPQLRALAQRPRLIVATPGRLLDHLKRRSLSLSQAKTLILDEADRILDMGFAPQLNQILKFLPTERQTLLFSATWNSEVDSLAKRLLKDPKRATVGTLSCAAPSVDQTVISTSIQNKNEALLDELNQRNGSVLVFARTQSRTDRVAHYLASYGVQVHRIHGGRTQGQRNSALTAFRRGEVRVLVATDIAARGIDVADIAHVINYDLPQSPEDYVHRIGRTGRAGATGQAVSLLTPADRAAWAAITRVLKKAGSSLPRAISRPISSPVSGDSARLVQAVATITPAYKITVKRS